VRVVPGTGNLVNGFDHEFDGVFLGVAENTILGEADVPDSLP